MYGTQTSTTPGSSHAWFENDVKMYGTQTELLDTLDDDRFENDVKMYGTQTIFHVLILPSCLRMM